MLFSGKQSIIMTSEVVPRALLGMIILESLKEKETKNKRGKTKTVDSKERREGVLHKYC